MSEAKKYFFCPEKTELDEELPLNLATLPEEVETSEKIASLRLESDQEKSDTTDMEELEGQARAAARKVLQSLMSWQNEYLRVAKF